MSANENSQDLVFTSNAAARVRAIMAEEGKDDMMLRVFVQGGGCSGFQYGFQLEESMTDGDLLVETDGIKMVVDPMSYQYLAGAEVDFVTGLQGAQFVINNPNASTTCGCGSSFTV